MKIIKKSNTTLFLIVMAGIFVIMLSTYLLVILSEMEIFYELPYGNYGEKFIP